VWKENVEVVSYLMDPPAGGEREEQFLFPCGERARASPLPVVTSYESVARKLQNRVVLTAPEPSVGQLDKCPIYRGGPMRQP